MNNIDNFAGLRGLDSSVGTSSSIGGMTNGISAVKQSNYDKYLLNTLGGLAAMNRPYVQMNSVDRIINCDGVIRNFKQGALKDSGFLSGLRSLSYTTEGARLIKQSIRKNFDNSVTVTFKGAGKSYNITPKEFQEASQKYELVEDESGSNIKYKEKLYARGDANVLAFELAMEKLQKDIQAGNVNNDLTAMFGDKKNSSMKDITPAQVYYIFNGNDSETISCNDELSAQNGNDNLNDFIEKYKNNPNKYATSFDVKDNIRMRDVYGNPVKLQPEQSYSLRSIDYTSAIYSDMNDTSRLIRVPIGEFKEAVNNLSFQDILKNSPVFEKPVKKDVDVYDFE